MKSDRKRFIDPLTDNLISNSKWNKIKINEKTYTGSVIARGAQSRRASSESAVKEVSNIYNVYIENIKRTEQFCNYQFISPSEMILSPQSMQDKEFFSDNQKYNYYNIEDLKYDLENIGSYLPIYVEENQINNKWVIRYGGHRLLAFNDSSSLDFKNNYKILTWIIDDDSKLLSNNNAVKLLYPKSLFKEYLRFLKLDRKDFSSGIVEITLKNKYDLYAVMTSLKVELNSLIDIYKQDLQNIGCFPSKIINSRG